MNKVIILAGVLLFVSGSALVLSAYFIFNKYSTSASHHFAYFEDWRAPDSPVELAEGEKGIFTVSTNGTSASADFYVESSDGSKVSLGDVGINGSWTFYYYVQKSDFYYCLLLLTSYTVQEGGVQGWLTAVLNIEVTNTPNLFFILIGIIVLLAGAVTVPCAFLTRRAHFDEKDKR